jgi:hypothetical protein
MEEKSYKLVKDDTIWKGDVLAYSLKELHITNHTKEKTTTCFWEYVKRIDSGLFPQIISSIAFFKSEGSGTPSEEISILIVENFRAPMEKEVLEFPFENLNEIDFQPLIEKLAKIEKEENYLEINEMFQKIVAESSQNLVQGLTGYSSSFKSLFKSNNEFSNKPNSSIYKNVYFSPWISNENSITTLVEIDKSKIVQSNISKTKQYEVKLKQLLDFVINKVNKENKGCAANLFYFAMGLHFKILLKEYF